MLPQNPSQQSNQGSANCWQWSTRRNLLVTLCVYKITNKGQSGWKLTSTLQEIAKVSMWQKRSVPFGLTGGSGWERRGAKECSYRMKHLFPSLPRRSFLIFPHISPLSYIKICWKVHVLINELVHSQRDNFFGPSLCQPPGYDMVSPTPPQSQGLSGGGREKPGPGQSPVQAPGASGLLCPHHPPHLNFSTVTVCFSIPSGRLQTAYLLKSWGQHSSLREAEYLGKCKHMLLSLLSYSLGKGIIPPREEKRTFEGLPHSTLAPTMRLQPLPLNMYGEWLWL